MPRRRLDLPLIFETLCERYFARELPEIDVIWCSPRMLFRGSNYHTYACYSHDYPDGDGEIWIDPALQAAWVPRYFVEYLVWHEACHAVLFQRSGDMHERHGPAFSVLERLHHGVDRALAWERRHVDRLTELLEDDER